MRLWLKKQQLNSGLIIAKKGTSEDESFEKCKDMFLVSRKKYQEEI